MLGHRSSSPQSGRIPFALLGVIRLPLLRVTLTWDKGHGLRRMAYCYA